MKTYSVDIYASANSIIRCPTRELPKYPRLYSTNWKLLVYRHGEVSEDRFSALPQYLQEGELMVFNNTRVIQARLHFRKETGALIEVFCLEPLVPADYALNFQQTSHTAWLCMIGNLKKWKEGELKRTNVKGQTLTLTAKRGECHGTSHQVDFSWHNPDICFSDILRYLESYPFHLT